MHERFLSFSLWALEGAPDRAVPKESSMSLSLALLSPVAGSADTPDPDQVEARLSTPTVATGEES